MGRVAVAPGKLLLFGEHAAVYGYPAVGMALPFGVTLRHEPSGSRGHGTGGSAAGHGTSEEELELGTLSVGGIPQRFHAAVQALFERLNELGRETGSETGIAALSELSGRIGVEAALPVAAGFGSSGAVCAAIAELALPAPTADTGGSQVSVLERWRLAHELEHLFHGTPSGVDTGLSCFGDTRYFYFVSSGSVQRELPETRPLAAPSCTLLAGAVPRHGDTKSLVGRIRAGWDDGEREIRSRIAALGQSAERAAALLDPGSGGAAIAQAGEIERSAGQAAELGRLANGAQEQLRALELSTDDLEAALRVGTAAGALGGKLSGAGGGGAFFLVFDGEERAERALEELRRRLGDRLLAAFLIRPVTPRSVSRVSPASAAPGSAQATKPKH